MNDMSKSNDWFLLANDFASYMDAQKEVDQVRPCTACTNNASPSSLQPQTMHIFMTCLEALLSAAMSDGQDDESQSTLPCA